MSTPPDQDPPEEGLFEQAANRLRQRGGAPQAEPTPQPKITAAPPPPITPAAPLSRVVDPPSTEQPARVKPTAKGGGALPFLNLAEMERQGLITPDHPRTRQGEEFRLIKRPLLQYALKSGERAARLVMVTSPYPNEGKSFVSVNLAMSLASERDLNVLLIDLDPYKFGSMTQLGVAWSRGLIDVLKGDATVDDVMIRFENIPNFAVIAPGQATSRTTELLASDGMGRLMTEINQRYADRIVIIDAPPVLEISEASAIALNVGQLIMVVSIDRSGPVSTASALGLVEACPRRYIVLNKVRPNQAAHGFGITDGYGYGYGYGNG